MKYRVAALVLGVGALVTGSGTARAHVDYVTNGPWEIIPPLRFVLDVFTNPVNVLLVLGGAATTIGVIVWYLRSRPAARDITVSRDVFREYDDLVPWILRLGFGLPLVGAGFANYLFSPVVPPFIPVVLAPSRLLQITIGFLLLFGLATRFAALVGLAAYLLAVPFMPDLLLANEYVAGFLAIILLGSGRPSADQILKQIAEAEGTVYGRFDPIHSIAQWLNRVLTPYEDYAVTIFRVGLGLNFMYLGLTQKILEPGRALLVVEKYNLSQLLPIDPEMWVLGVGLTEMMVGAALFLGFFTRGFAMLSFVIFTTTLFGIPDDPVLAHVTLFAMTSALIITGSGPLGIDRLISFQTTPVETSTSGDESATVTEQSVE